jgi:YD repeat-containing protein
VAEGATPTNYQYNLDRQLTRILRPDGDTVRFTYDVRGRLDSVIDPLDRASTFAYDSADRVIEQTLPDGRTVGYGYDANGNLTGVTPPDRPVHEFTYTPVDLTASYDPPEVAEGATHTNYQYNLDGQLTRILRPDGDTVRFTYDTAGRPQGVIRQDGSLVYGYSGVGNLAAVLAPAESLAFSYDGSLLTGATWTGPVSGAVNAAGAAAAGSRRAAGGGDPGRGNRRDRHPRGPDRPPGALDPPHQRRRRRPDPAAGPGRGAVPRRQHGRGGVGPAAGPGHL